LIPGHCFNLIRGAGHLPMIERPDEYAGVITDFLQGIGHV
jgi:3-oxoadipate enol-lactonase